MRLTAICKKALFPFYWPFIDRPWDRKVIFAFTKWFGSIPGFKQQVLIILGWTIVDLIDPALDSHMLVLMAFLTIYSGGTQPALAIGNEQAMEMQVQLLKNNVDQLAVMVDMLTKLHEMQVQDSALLDAIADDVEDIKEGG